MRRIVAMVRLNELHSIRVEVPEWEIPILQRIHTDHDVKIEGESECTMRCPDPADEFVRLERRYGVDRETRVPHVASVYPSMGALEDAMSGELERQAAFDEADAKRAKKEASSEPAGDGKNGARKAS